MSLSLTQRYIVASLRAHMQTCQRQGISFSACLAEARKQFEKEQAIEQTKT